jgi:hypothetical protein
LVLGTSWGEKAGWWSELTLQGGIYAVLGGIFAFRQVIFEPLISY